MPHGGEPPEVDSAGEREVLLVAIELYHTVDDDANVGCTLADPDRNLFHHPLQTLGLRESGRRRIVAQSNGCAVRKPDRRRRVRVFNTGYNVSITHQVFDQHRVLKPCTAEAVREGDNRKRRAARGDWRVVDRMRGNLSRNDGCPSGAELAAHELVDLGKGVHLCRAWEVLSLCAGGFRRRIPEVDHQLSTAFGIVVIGPRCVGPLIANPADAKWSRWRRDLRYFGSSPHATRCAWLLVGEENAEEAGDQNA